LPVHNVYPVQTRSDDEIAAILASVTEGSRRVWMLHYDPPTTSIEYWLARHAWLADRSRYGDENLTLSVYGLPGLAQRDVAQGASFGDELRLVDSVVAGGTGDSMGFLRDLLGVTTVWNVLDSPPPLNFSLRLRDDEGRTWLSSDYVPLEGSASTQLWSKGERVEDRSGLVLPADLPSGSYEVFLALQDAPTGARFEWAIATERRLLDSGPAAAAQTPPVCYLRTRTRDWVRAELLGFNITPQPCVRSRRNLTLRRALDDLVRPIE
jgi:hypothetical protein